MIKLEH